MSKFAKLANVDEGTILRLRRGHLARRGTINSLLRAFSEVYGMKFTLENVSGLKKVEKPIALVDEKSENSPMTTTGKTAKRVTEKPQKRVYKPRDTGLPEGCILASKFAEQHGVPRPTFTHHMLIGLGPGTVPGEQDSMLPVKEQVDYSKRDHPSRKGETERYLTSAQQAAALDFWRRHGVAFTMPETEQEVKQEPAWYLPDQKS
jgi:hypothetical protein